MPNADKLAEFAAWRQKNITGDEKGQAQISLDRLFQAFGQRFRKGDVKISATRAPAGG